MANFRKILATLSTVAILSTLVVTTAVSAGTYTDVPADSWAKSYIDNLVELGVFTGEGKFRPAENMSRAEFVKSVVVAAGLEGSTAITFPDIKDGDWFAPYVKTAVANGVISGYANGKFGPNDSLTREQAAKITVNAFDLPAVTPTSPSFSDVKSTDWSYGYVETLVSYGIVSGYGNGKFGPMDPVKREQVAKIVSLALNPEAPVVVDDDEVVVVEGGELGVALSDETPAAVTLPSNATAAAVFAVDLTAGDTDVTFNGFTVHKKGVGALPTTMQAYLYDGDDRLTAGKSLNSSTNNIEFSNVGFKVAAGSTATLTMKIDVGDVTATGEVQFELLADTSVKSTADAVAGDFPIVSETIGLSTTDVGTITIAKNGATTNPKVGQVGATVAKFTLNAATEAAKLSKLGLYVTGTISSDDVTNLKLYVTGVTDPLAEVDGINAKDLAQFVFETPYEIEKGGTKSFYVTADMSPGRNTDTLAIYVDENTDVVAIGATYGFGMAVTKTNYMSTTCTAASSTTCSFSTLEGGDITIVSSGPSAMDIAVNSKDVHLVDFTITAVSDVTFKNLPVGLDASEVAAAGGLLNSTTANFTDIKIINTETGESLMGPVDVTSFTNESVGSSSTVEESDGSDTGSDADDDLSYYLFTDEFSMSAGQTLKLALTTDVANNTSLNTDTLVASIQLGATYPQVKDVNNKTLTNSSSIVPSSAITGKTMTVKSPSLTMSLASTPSTKTYVKGVKDIKFTGLQFACGSASDCKITSLSLQGYIDDNGNASAFSATGTGADNSTLINTYVGSVALKDASGKDIAASKSVQSDGDVDYTNLSWIIKAGESVTAYVVGDLSSNAYANSDAENIAFGIASVDDVTVEDKDGNSLATASKTGTPNTSQTTYVTTSAGGSLTVAVDTSTPKNNILVAGSADQTVSKYKFTTTDEAFSVKKIAVNNRQSVVTAAANLGDYDDNLVSIKLSYTNSAGVAETKTGTLTNGTAEFSGMDMPIAADDSAVLTVSATLNTISGGADAGTLVDLNLAFEQFEAIAQGSGETYKGDKIDATTVAASDLDFGTPTWTDPSGFILDGAEATVTLGSSLTFDVDEGDDTAPLIFLPVGALVCFNADVVDTGADATTSGDCGSNDNIAIITGRTAGSTEDTYTALVVDDADAAMVTNLAVYYSLPGTGYLTAAKEQVVYESKPVIALDSSSPSGSRSVSSTDRPFVFTVQESGGKEKIQFRLAEINPATAATTDWTSATALAGTFTATDALSTVTSGGIANSAFQRETSSGTNGAGITYTITSTSLAGYSGISFWTRASEAANTITLTINGSGSDPTVASGTMTADTWQFVNLSFADLTAAQLTAVTTLDWTVTDASAVNAATYDIDEITLYYDKVTVTATSDSDFDTNTASSADNLVAYLKDGNDTVMTGYWYSSTQSADASSESVTLYPTSTDFEISKGTTKTLALQTDTGSLMAEDAGTDDPVTFSIDLGTMSTTVGTVTAGGLWWYDTNAQVKWLGDVANSTFSSNTVKY